MADSVIKVVAGCAALWVNSMQAINGALCGAAVRLMVGDNDPRDDEQSLRASCTASLCFTFLSIAYALATPGPHSIIPLIFGFSAAADGAYCLMRTVVGQL